MQSEQYIYLGVEIDSIVAMGSPYPQAHSYGVLKSIQNATLSRGSILIVNQTTINML